ncbi:hypothetical protein BT96DRAFT_1054381 [Gymnopus androsaceus JB14]|uniref:Uncharacterized protein n=1 Tax=Gymnopus androsaceus JB14 TaxID=1447944 RepID=A0A6A4IMR5_9AGAR|nr:hypothetical protein BT96DRAFT_1054381 [Gymnopus androsaceus JB14]
MHPTYTSVLYKPALNKDISAIDTKECHGMTNATKANLPLSTTSDLHKWDAEFMLTITDFVGAQNFQYSMSNIDFKFFIKSTWKMVYPFLKELKDNPTIATLVHNQICTYQSKSGKKAMSVVAQRPNTHLRMILKNAQHGLQFSFMRTTGLMTHLDTLMFKAKLKSGFPAGALVLAEATRACSG